MDVMGPLHENPQYMYVLVIHDTYLGMIWVRGLANKAQATTEVSWWMSEVQQSTQQQAHKIMLAQCIKEVRVNQGEL